MPWSKKNKIPTFGRVCVSYPYNGLVTEEWASSMFTFLVMEYSTGLIGSFYKSMGSGIPYNRNRNIAYYLAHTSDEWLMQVDTDIEFLPDAPRKLLEAATEYGCKIIGAAALLANQSVVFYRKGEVEGTYNSLAEIDDEVYELDVVGSGLLMVHRSVFVKMRDKYKGPWHWVGHDQEGDVMLGDDFTFCRRAAACGFKIHGHGGVRVNHYKSLPIEWPYET